MRTLTSMFRPAIVLFAALTIITGAVYPLVVTGAAQAFWPRQANGSMIERQGRAIGSSLIGQEFSEPRYLWGRLSATSPDPYTAFNAHASTGSSGSNLGPTNPDLIAKVKARVDALRAADAVAGARRPAGTERPAGADYAAGSEIPVDLVTASASGLDPHISVAAAEWQIPRIARTRGIPESEVRRVIEAHTQGRQFGFLGEPVVVVLEANLALDELQGQGEKSSNPR